MKPSDKIILWSVLILFTLSFWVNWIILQSSFSESAVKNSYLTLAIIGLVALLLAVAVKGLYEPFYEKNPRRK
jgi:hypothetical protein